MSTANSTPNLPPDELGEPVDGEPMVDQRTGKKILRPRNAWILYRNSRLDDVPVLSDGSRQPMADASKIISAWWKSETGDVKYKYELEAEKEKEEHKRRYPNYRFQPMSKAQKAQKKAESRERAKQAQVLKRKTKTQKSPPPQAYATSTHTSYLAAAVANYAQGSSVAPLAVPVCGAQGPSPPTSLASTPTTTPSPFPSSDFEQGSSTSATSAHTMPSPSDALGLGLPSPLNFGGQEEAIARVPRRAPARLPPRPRGPKIKSETPISSRVTSFSSATARALSPATSTTSALSPLPWPLPNNNAHQPQSSYLLRANSPPTTIDPSVIEAPQPWYASNVFDSTQDSTTTIGLDFAIPNSLSDEFFSNLAAGEGIPVMPESTGIFSMPMDDWNGQPPDQFNVSLTSSDSSSTPLTPEDEQRFSAFLFDLLNSNDSGSNSVQNSSAPVPPMTTIPEVVGEHDEWHNWVSSSETSQGEIPSSALPTSGNDLPSFDTRDVDVSMAQGPTPPADFSEPGSSVRDEPIPGRSQFAPLPPHDQIPTMDENLPPHLATDPTFLHFYGQYLAHKQGSQQVETNTHPQETYSPHSPQQQSQLQYHHSQDHSQYNSPASSHAGSRQPSYVVHSRQVSIAVPISPAPSGNSLESPGGHLYTPPSGAATNIGLRRVAATWKTSPGSRSPTEYGNAPRNPPWGSVTSN